ncbi:MAG TPA: LemA family protein [Actinomycetota bacterium]|nr:LemA family protein [Actinomycetota bacterium]
MGFLIALLVVVVLVALMVMALYNRFVTMRNRSQNAWAQVDVQLRRRYDLIPNLVETVKGYASHEREVFERVTQARSMGASAQTVAEQAQAENMITSALRQLMAVSENYPQLRANENFQQLQAELAETEDQIAVARQIYNDTVLMYNNAIQTFPGVMLAGPFGFVAKEYLEIEEVSRQPAKVDFRDMPGRVDFTGRPEESPPAQQ